MIGFHTLPVYTTVFLSIASIYIYLSICLSVSLSVCLFIHISSYPIYLASKVYYYYYFYITYLAGKMRPLQHRERRSGAALPSSFCNSTGVPAACSFMPDGFVYA